MNQRTQTTLELMRDPSRWPLGVVLPLVRPTRGGGWPSCAFITSVDGPKIFFGLAGDSPATCKSREYESFDAIVADGWRVD